MYTEEEAKEKWCPFVRRTSIDASLLKTRPNAPAPSIPVNRGIEDDFMCVGPKCAAWRPNKDDWVERTTEGPAGHATTREHRKSGYCGLAGKPE